MSKPLREPQPGLYLDTSQTLYKAHYHPKTGWSLQRHQHRSGLAYDNHPFPYANFAQAVANHVFTITPNA